MSAQKPREIAARVLQRRHPGRFVEQSLDAELSQARLSPPDRGLCQELVYGVIRNERALDWLIARKTNGRPQKPALQVLLRLGLYQIFFLDRVPGYAAVNESVEMARNLGFGPQSGFINAVLRGYLRERELTIPALRELQASNPALGWSHPDWLVKRWQERYGLPATAKLLEWNNSPPETFARVNTLQDTPAALLPRWREEGVKYDFVRVDWAPENLLYRLQSHPPLNSLVSFESGSFYVQDPSTLLSVHLLNPQPGEFILDLCSAPGGKLTYTAQCMQNQGRIIAHDLNSERIKLIEENINRLGVTCAEPVTPDWLNTNLRERFDRILIDAPCSNTGVMRRRVELRHRIAEAEIGRLQAAQSKLLSQAASLLKPGGVIVYSTCSLEPEENEMLVAGFLRENTGFALETQRQLTPQENQVDGAYCARLRLNASQK